MAFPPNWQASFQQGFREASTRFQTGASQFQQTMQQGMYGAQNGFQSAAQRVSVAARGYSTRFNGYGGGEQGQPSFAQMSSSNPQFGAPPPMAPMRNDNQQVGFNFPEKPMANNNHASSDPARCSSKTILGLFVIFLILAAAGAGVGVLFSLNDQRRADQGFGAADGGGGGNETAAETAFNIELLFLGEVSDQQKQAFESAKARWSQVIVGDLVSEAVYAKGDNFCAFTADKDIVIDDLLIVVSIKAIDGPGRILGSAGPCGFDDDNMPRMGVMEFDVADVAQLLSVNQFTDVVLHEMGHVLGLGSLWDSSRLLTPSLTPSSGPSTAPVAYLGREGNIGNTEIGASGRAVVENLGGPGTARGHWKDTTYQNELMTGFLSPGANPLSRLTVRALADLGYTVDPTKADNFQFPSGRRLDEDEHKERLSYGDDIRQHPMSQMQTRTKGMKSHSFSLQPMKARKIHTG